LAGSFIPNDSPYAAAVRYEVVAGARARFGEVAVVGAHEVSPAVVERMLTFRAGDLYRHRELLSSQRNLYGLEVFRRAEIRPLYEAAYDSLIPVLVDVAEGNLHRVRLGVGLSTADCLNAEGRWTSRNFRGG